MRAIAIDEYYLTEQDEATVRVHLGLAGLEPCGTAPEPVAATSARHASRSVRRRLHLLRRVAMAAIAA